jgi:hypothetical protein
MAKRCAPNRSYVLVLLYCCQQGIPAEWRLPIVLPKKKGANEESEKCEKNGMRADCSFHCGFIVLMARFSTARCVGQPATAESFTHS